jgi:hypothetical protein
MAGSIDQNENKRDPTDLTQAEVTAILQEIFGWSFQQAVEEDLPQHDYESSGHQFWWTETFHRWLKQEFSDYRARVLLEAEMLELKMAVNEAREELDRQRRKEEELRWWTDRAGSTTVPTDAGGTDFFPSITGFRSN